MSSTKLGRQLRAPRFRRALLVAACAAAAACGDASQSDDAAEGDESNFTLDPGTPDPNNPWMKGVDPASLAIGQEVVLPGEDQEFDEIAHTINWMQDQLASRNGGVGRTFHQKLHACVLGEFHVAVADAASEARVGLFAKDATYPAWIRLSNGVGFRQKDKAVDARGIAVKVMKVPGKKLLAGREDALTQDFLAINSPVQPAADVRQFIAFGKAMVEGEVAGDDPALHLPGGLTAAFPGVDFGGLNRLFKQGGFLLRPESGRTRNFLLGHIVGSTLKNGSLLGEEFFSGAPIAFGVSDGDPMTAPAKRAAKFKLAAGVLENGSCRAIDKRPDFGDDDYLKTDLLSRIKREDACVQLLVQFQNDPARQFIEDASVDWKGSPFVSVGYVVLPKTDFDSPDAQAKQAFCQTLGFSPWHTLPAHRPLGNMMRARRVVYEASREHRSGVLEPTGDEFPVR